MDEICFLVITFDSEVQMTSSFDCCASFHEIFHRTPIMTMMLHNWGGAKWPKMAQNYHLHSSENQKSFGLLNKKL